ncbi:MAG: heme A synthase [Alphaproteobacteria bacterium HGW-Alphaproteobacteria-2]|nr:MAG: heme A synthase [Alphaproteobacteria bacterium HGW-Alphaproteobacteria-2]
MAGGRSIFEEVGAGQAPAMPGPGRVTGGGAGARAAIRLWLLALFALVVLMIAVGGMTRLTDSGLSITEWRPVTGALPPVSEADWQAEFEKYRQIPQYQLLNRGMSLAEFKAIYWWEWGHRQLGRLIGLVWAAGFLWFLVRRRIPPGWTGRLLLPGVLGGVQGAIGWWMVASGLSGEAVSVASYRLATHLGLAFLILGLLWWLAQGLGRAPGALLQARRMRETGLAAGAGALVAFAGLQILLGALVAGIDAGRGFTDWPLMGGAWLPPDPFALTPLWRNFFEDAGLVQFLHRLGGYLLLLAALVFWWRARQSPHPATRRACAWVLVAVFGQMVLGIVTLLHGAPLQLAILHQLGAVAVLAAILRARFLALHPLVAGLRGARA